MGENYLYTQYHDTLMDRLEHLSADQLREHLDSVEGKRATLRLVVGINYLQGIPQSELANWYGVSRTTIHNWLERLEQLPTESLETVIYDAPRPGRPSKLTPDQRDTLAATLEDPPTSAGIDAKSWTPPRVQQFTREQFGVEYSLRHSREIMHEIG